MRIGTVFLFAVVTWSGAARAEDPDVARLNQAGRSIKWNTSLPNKSGRYGHAEVLINAPLAAVRNHVTAYHQYRELVPRKFNNARVVAKESGATDVYFQVNVMHGLVSLWQVLRFEAPQVVEPGIEVLEGRFVRGNVKTANLVFTLKRVDDNFTILKLDLLILPNVPAPQSALDEELRDAAMDAVDALHRRVQGHARNVLYQTTR